MLRWGYLFLLLATAGCVPVFAHGPRVEPGFSGGASAGLTLEVASCRDRAPAGSDGSTSGRGGCRAEGGLVPVYLSGRHGWTGDSLAAATSVGLNLPLAPHRGTVFFTQLDVYRQLRLPGAAAMDRGVGVVTSLLHLAPYVQLGRTRPDGGGWYTSQAILLPLSLVDDDIVGAPEINWVPSFSWGGPLGEGAGPDAARGSTQLVGRTHLIGSFGMRDARWRASGTLALSLELRRRR